MYVAHDQVQNLTLLHSCKQSTKHNVLGVNTTSHMGHTSSYQSGLTLCNRLVTAQTLTLCSNTDPATPALTLTLWLFLLLQGAWVTLALANTAQTAAEDALRRAEQGTESARDAVTLISVQLSHRLGAAQRADAARAAAAAAALIVSPAAANNSEGLPNQQLPKQQPPQLPETLNRIHGLTNTHNNNASLPCTPRD